MFRDGNASLPLTAMVKDFNKALGAILDSLIRIYLTARQAKSLPLCKM